MLALTIRLVCSLALVIGLLLLIARFGGRKMRGGRGELIQVLQRQPLSRTSSITVVSVGTRVLVLGGTEQQVSLLAELDPDELDVPELSLVPDEGVEDLPAPAPIRRTPSATGRLAGSVLAPETWRQAMRAATGRIK